MSSRSLLVGALVAAVTFACGPSDGGVGPGVTTGGSAGSSGSAVVGGSAGSLAGSAGAMSGGAGGSTAAGAGGAPIGGGGGTGAPIVDCTTAPTSLLCMPLGAMPASIKDTGLFPAAPDLSKHSVAMLEYVPDPALWSDGMQKQRFLILPPGKKIDNTNRKQWGFPDGTLFVKTFFDDTGAQGAPRPIETRLIRATNSTSYEFFVYQWNADSTDAALVVSDIDGDINAEIQVPVTVNHMVDGQPLMVNNGQSFMHTLPSRNDCGSCHEHNGMVAQTFIGFDELRLNSKLKADSPKTQLQTFVDAGIFTLPAPADPATITDASNDGGRLLRIKRFAFGNCVTCHNGEGQFDLHPDVLVANTVNKATEAQSVKPPAGWLRVIPGDPSKSVVYVQMQRTMLPMPTGNDADRLRAMPPIGVADVAADQAALKDVFDWITALPK